MLEQPLSPPAPETAPRARESSRDVLDELAALFRKERAVLLSRWRAQVRQLPSAAHLDVPTLTDHIPLFLDELEAVLRSRSASAQPASSNVVEDSAPAHGIQRFQDAFDIVEVVAEYSMLRGCLHDLADENGLSLQGEPFRILNRVLDHGIGFAVEAFATRRALEVQQRREEYLAFVAHDLRTPLNAISLAGRILELTLPGQGSRPETAQMLKVLRRNVQHLDALVSKVVEENTNLETESGIRLERREIDLWPLVESLVHDLHPMAGTAGTALRNQVPEELVVYADAGLLRRIFQNLIANAITYTPRGEVVLGARELSGEGVVECWVADDGAGIPAEALDRVFDKGETDPGNAGGTGLGLAIVKTFTEAHGGTVTVDSTLGVGSTFRFTLPTKAGVRGGASSS